MTQAPYKTAMILAAGRGQRMMPLTAHTPKPLLKVGAYRLIEWQIKALVNAGVQRIIINHAWLGEQFAIELGYGQRYDCEIIYSPETVALETAGGIARALTLLNTEQPFIVVSGDIFTDFEYAQLPQLTSNTVAHLVLTNNPDYHPNGDMGLSNGIINDQTHPKFTYANIGVFHPSIFQTLDPNSPQKLFPWLYQQGVITGQHYSGVWHNVGTPEQLTKLDHSLNTHHT